MPRTAVQVGLLSALTTLFAAMPGSGAAAQVASELDVSALASTAAHDAPAAAFDGTSHLVVWEESDAIWGAVLDVGGAVVAAPFRISPPAEPLSPQAAPAVAAAASGGGFLVVWAEAAASTGWDIRGARVSTTGSVLHPDGFGISTVFDGTVTSPAPGAQELPAVAASGSEFLVVWQDGRLDAAAPDIFGTRVASDGTVIGSGGIAISQRAGAQRRPAVASNGAAYLVVWEDVPADVADVYGARVDAITGAASVEFAISTDTGDQLQPSVTSNGSAYAVAWNDQRSGSWDLMVARVDHAGVIDASGIRVAAVEAGAPHAIASDGSGFLVVYERSPSGALGARLDASGVASGEFTVDATDVIPPGQALTFASFGQYLAVHRSDVSGIPQLSAWLVTTLERLDVLHGGTGSGSVTSAPSGIDCGTTCAAEFETGMAVGLSATAAGGSVFESWTGCESASGTSCAVTMSAPLSVTATFLAEPGAPGGPTYSDIGATSLTVSWTAAEGATGYDLERALDAGAGPGTYETVATVAATSHPDTGLAPNAAYWYRVHGTNAAGSGAYGPATSVTTLPGVPGTPTFSAIAADAVTVSWIAPEGGAEGYELERATSAGTDWAPMATLAGTSHTDTTVAAGTEYLYRVRATNTAGKSPYSATASVTTLPPPPDAPAAPTYADVAVSSVTVGWTAVTGATSYALERAPDVTGAPGTWAQIAAGLATTSYASTGLAGNTTYWYRVRASNSGGDSAFSTASSVTTLPGASGAPTFGAITTTALTVSWTAPEGGATSYSVERAPSATGTWTVLVSGLTSLSHADSGLAAGTTYWYRVLASNSSGTGAYSASASVATLPDAPGAPTFTNVASSSVTVSWTAVTGATGYKLERAPDPGGATAAWVQVASVATTTYDDTGLAGNATYWYRVRATSTSGDGEYSAERNVLTLPRAPGTPAFAGMTTTSVTVSWAAPEGGAATYSVERAPTATGTWLEIANGLTALSHTDSGLIAGTTYWYRVRAWNATGAGAYSAVASVPTLPAAPGAPTYTNITSGSATVSWSAVTGATAYRLERAPDAGGTSGSWAEVASVATTTYDDVTLAGNATYWYRVRATNDSGDGPYSADSSVLTVPRAPGAPSFTSVTPTSLTVSWSEPPGGAVSYELERATSADGPWTQIGGVLTALGYDDAGLAPGVKYWYRVRGVNATGPGPYSASASVTTLPDSTGAPWYTGVATVSLTVNWAVIPGATTYHVERALDVGGPWQLVAAGLTDTYRNEAVAANTTYWYRVRGANESGYGAWSPASSVTTLANAPSAAPTFTNVTDTALTVNWTAPVGGAASYVVERATSSLGPWAVVASGVTTLSWDDSGLSPETTYWYAIRATNSAGATGPPSRIAAVTTLSARPSDAPGAPTFSSVGTTSVVVAWTAAADATSYQLERAPDAGNAPGAWSQIASVSVRAFTDTGLGANTRYWYRVRASNEGGAGPYSAASSVVTLPNAPGTPTFPVIDTTTLTVSWTEPAGGAASYLLERSTSDKPWAIVASGLTTPSYADTGLTANSVYYYRVRGTNAAGQSGAVSGVGTVTTSPDGSTPTGTPGTPTYSSVTATAVTVAWSAATGAEVYTLERAADANGAPDATWTQIASLTTLSYRDGGRTANTVYWYRVRASSVAGTTVSGESRVMTAPNAPGAPTFPTVTAASVTVSWSPPAGGAASYKLERAPSSIGPWALLGAGILTTSLVDAVSGNTTYYYRVRATNAAGLDGQYSASSSITTPADTTTLPPAAPAAPTFSSITATYLKVSWAAVTDATGYEVERAMASTGPWAQIAATTATSLTDTGRTPNTVYWYRVRASNGGGIGPHSPASSAMTAPTAPGAPTFPSIGTTTVTVSWTAPTSGAASYKLERATSSIGPWAAVAGSIVALSYADSGLTGYTTYYYRVRATNSAGVDGAASASGSVLTAQDPTAPTPGQPGTPTYSSITATYVKVSWASATDATSYKVERATASTGSWTPIASTTATSFTDTGRSANTVYWYRVRGSNGGGDGPYSSESSVMTAPDAPGAPTFSSIGATTLTVSWTAPPGGAATYKLERATSAVGPWAAVSGITALSYADSGLTGYTTYYYRVRATNSAGLDGASSASRSVLTAPDAAATPPGAPGIPTYSSVTASYVKVSWAAATDAASYELERAAASTGPWTRVTVTSATSFTDTGMAANTAYWYQVRASNGAGTGPYSEVSGVVTAPNAPGAPEFTSVTSAALTASWSAPIGGAATYKLERATSSVGPWTVVASGITAQTRGDSGLTAYTTYYYRVRGTNSAGVDGLASYTAAVTTEPDGVTVLPGAPGTPTFSNVNATWLTVTWTAASDATSYELERATASGGPWTSVATTTTTSFSDTGRVANTRYWYRVRGSNGGGFGPHSEVSSVVTAPNAPGAPTFGSVEATTLVVSWTAPAGGAASYRVERATSAIGPWAEIAPAVTSLDHADSGLTASTAYYYRIRATNEDGINGAYSLVKSVTTAAVPGS